MLKAKNINCEFHALPGDAPLAPSHEVLARIEEIWAVEKKRRGKDLINGSIFSTSKVTDTKAIGWLAEYKWFVAQRREPALFRHLQVIPLAVTGLLLCKDGVVIGKRSNYVEQDAGSWELVPSGGVDGSTKQPNGIIDLQGQLLKELVEEIGITKNAVHSRPVTFIMVEDECNHVIDIGISLHISISFEEVKAIFNNLDNREYVALDVLPTDHLHEHEKYACLASVSQTMLERFIQAQ